VVFILSVFEVTPYIIITYLFLFFNIYDPDYFSKLLFSIAFIHKM